MSNKFMTVRMPESEKAKFKAWTETLSAENKVECKKIVINTIQGIDRRAKMFAPVNKRIGRGGFLRASIHPRYNADGLGGSVYTNTSYAAYQEFGTGTGVVAPEDVKEYAMTFKGEGKRKVNMRAQPYLFPAVRIGQKEMLQKLENLGFKRV